jgi:hypothetical protein
MNLDQMAEKAGKSGDDILDFVRLSVVMMRQDPDLIREVTVDPCPDDLVTALQDKIALKACYHNTWEAMQVMRRHDPHCRYVLGYWCHIIPVEHCFLKYNNKYYDPTALLFNDNSQVRYFSMFKLSMDELRDARRFMRRKFNINDHISAWEWMRMCREKERIYGDDNSRG